MELFPRGTNQQGLSVQLFVFLRWSAVHFFKYHTPKKTRLSSVSVRNKASSTENRSPGSALCFLYISIKEVLKIRTM